jgi:Uma2 family endonuclease
MPPKRVTFQEYLDIERHSDTKHEFVDGWMFDPNDGWWPGQEIDVPARHDQIVHNLANAIRAAAPAGWTVTEGPHMPVFSPSVPESPVYPDLCVFLEPAQGRCNHPVETANRTAVVFDVLATSTEAFDRGEKARLLRGIDGLQAHILISQRAAAAEIAERSGKDEWRLTFLKGSSDVLRVPQIRLAIPLATLYAGIA